MENITLQSMLRVKHGESDEPVSSNDTQGAIVNGGKSTQFLLLQ